VRNRTTLYAPEMLAALELVKSSHFDYRPFSNGKVDVKITMDESVYKQICDIIKKVKGETS